MDTIRFEETFNKETYIRSNRIYWNYVWHRRIKQMKQWTVLLIIIVGLGIFIGIKEQEWSNPYIFAGILSFLLIATTALQMFFSHKRHQNEIRKNVAEQEKNPSVFKMEMTDESVHIQDFRSDITLHWTAFKYYTIYKGNILLIPENYIAGGLVIEKESESPEKYDQVTELLKNKVKYKNSSLK